MGISADRAGRWQLHFDKFKCMEIKFRKHTIKNSTSSEASSSTEASSSSEASSSNEASSSSEASRFEALAPALLKDDLTCQNDTSMYARTFSAPLGGSTRFVFRIWNLPQNDSIRFDVKFWCVWNFERPFTTEHATFRASDFAHVRFGRFPTLDF